MAHYSQMSSKRLTTKHYARGKITIKIQPGTQTYIHRCTLIHCDPPSSPSHSHPHPHTCVTHTQTEHTQGNTTHTHRDLQTALH